MGSLLRREGIHPACIDVVELATEYLEGSLGPRDRAIFEQHLLVCPPCESYLGQLRATVSEARVVPSAAIPDDVMGGLLEAYRAIRSGGREGER